MSVNEITLSQSQNNQNLYKVYNKKSKHGLQRVVLDNTEQHNIKGIKLLE